MNEEKILKLGKMTTKELAEWMGIKYATFRTKTKERLEKLKDFADFETTYGGVIIKDIKIPTYIKNFGNDDKAYAEAVKESENGLCTIAGIVRKLQLEKEEYKNLSYDAVYYRMKKAGERTFGKTQRRRMFEAGAYGRRWYLWAIKLDNYNHYRLMTEEEEKTYNDLVKRYMNHGGAECVSEIALLRDAYKCGEICGEEYAEYSDAVEDFYDQVITTFCVKTSVSLVRTTMHEFLQNCSEEDFQKIQEREKKKTKESK